SQDVYVDVTTVDGTATAGSDYVPQTRHLYFPAGYTSSGLTVPIISDNVMEPNETFTVVLSNPVNATLGPRTQAVVTIVNDDFALASLSPANIAVTEGNGASTDVTFAMIRSRPAAFAGTMYGGTQDGTATAGSDYVGATGSVTFAPYETSKTFTVTVLGDTVVEAD